MEIEEHFKEITPNNIQFYMAVHYSDIQAQGSSEFYEDVKRITYMKRLLKVYNDSGELKTRLLLNHIISFSNLFGPTPSFRILLARLEPEHHPIIATCYRYLGYIVNVPGITYNQKVAEELLRI